MVLLIASCMSTPPFSLPLLPLSLSPSPMYVIEICLDGPKNTGTATMGTLHNKLVMQTPLIGWRCSIGCCSRESSPYTPHLQHCTVWFPWQLRTAAGGACVLCGSAGLPCAGEASASQCTAATQQQAFSNHTHTHSVIHPLKHVCSLAV